MTKAPVALEKRASEDGRLFSPSAGRNKTVIADSLASEFPAKAHVLEIASGTGEHGVAILSKRPDLHLQFSDPNPESRASQQAWMNRRELELPTPLDLDVTQLNWAVNLAPVDAIFCANMIHIAPWAATEGLAAGAAEITREAGTVFLYGPFLFGENSAPSNLDFDRNLKARNPAWGVRELDSVKHIFAQHGFNRAELRDMPANNHILSLFRL